MARKSLYLKGKKVGVITDNTYNVLKLPKHFMRKFAGFGISERILDMLVAERVKDIVFHYRGKQGDVKYRVPLAQYLSSTKTYVNKENDHQVFVSCSDMELLG